MVTKFLFWNTGLKGKKSYKKLVDSALIKMVSSLQCDVVALAEYNEDPAALLDACYREGVELYLVPHVRPGRVLVLTKFPPSDIQHHVDTPYCTVYAIPHENETWDLYWSPSHTFPFCTYM